MIQELRYVRRVKARLYYVIKLTIFVLLKNVMQHLRCVLIVSQASLLSVLIAKVVRSSGLVVCIDEMTVIAVNIPAVLIKNSMS